MRGTEDCQADGLLKEAKRVGSSTFIIIITSQIRQITVKTGETNQGLKMEAGIMK
jgi:hypothetical protein